MAGRLTTHVLDVAQGRPAAGMQVDLWQLTPGERTRLCSVRTNAAGRVDNPLLAGDALQVGLYELEFYVAEYFQAQGVATSTPPFLERVPVRFGVADNQAHYHVPLVVSPWSYSTYRGS